MATSVLKSYRNVISRLPDPSHPSGPLTTTNTIFQVPVGKTWLVIKLWSRTIEWNKPLSSFQIEKTRGDGSDPLVLAYPETETISPLKLAATAGPTYQNLVFGNEEMLRQVVEATNDVVLVMQYEISVLEIAPV